MKKVNEVKKMMTTQDKAELQFQKIKHLYEQMIGTTVDDDAYRAKLLTELSKYQKEDGSFSVIDDYHCDSDVRVFYCFYPTYYATAAMIYLVNHDGMNSTVEKCLESGLHFSMGRHLKGHGYDAVGQQLEALSIYKKAGIYEWMANYKSQFPLFTGMLQDIIENYRSRLTTGNIIDDWQVDFTKQFQNEIDEYDTAFQSYVWYAAYGSNISYDRFMEYILECTDKSRPLNSKAITLPYDIYFAYKSRRWGRKGVAFLDDTHPGMSLGRMYLISREQFSQIQKKEGAIYKKKLFLGREDQIPVYTFTSPEKRTDYETPSVAYISTILKGLMEVYTDKTELVLSTYLYGAGALNSDDRNILRFIRNSEHGVSLQTISDNTASITRVKITVKKLIEHQFLKQDGRNAADGIDLTSPEAIVYTRKPKRELIDILLLNIR